MRHIKKLITILALFGSSFAFKVYETDKDDQIITVGDSLPMNNIGYLA